MANQKKTLANSLSDLFTNLFHNFSKLMLTNLLFAVPFAVFFGIFWFINYIFGLNSNIIIFLTVIPLFPFYAGVVQITAHMIRGEENVKVFENFVLGVKENFLRFLIHGVVFYGAIFFGYSSITLYSALGKENGMFYTLLAISIIITIVFLFMFYYVPSMTVTFDISMKHIYKNSALMSFGELKSNIIATFGVLVIGLLCATILFCCYYPIAIIIATIILTLFFVPAIMSYIINSAIYKPMYRLIVNKSDNSKTIDKKIENRKKGQFFDDFSEPQPDISEDFSDIDIDESADGDEYIYYNGKMVKRSVLINHKKNTEKNGDD